MDYRGLNAFTSKNKYLLPLIWETLDCLCKATYYIKLDIIRAFNCICIAAGEEWKTAFRTCLGIYKYLVLLFGLSNGQSTFQNYINNVLGNNILDLFVIVYVDNILVFSKTLQEYRKHVKSVIAHLQDAGPQLDI